MTITLRFYAKHDFFFMYILQSAPFDVNGIIYQSLKAFVNNEKYIIPSFDISDIIIPKDGIRVNLVLDPSKDSDVIDFISTIPAGIRNSVIRNIINQSVSQKFILDVCKAFPKQKDFVYPINYEKNNSKQKRSQNKNIREKNNNQTIIKEIDKDNFEKTHLTSLQTELKNNINYDTLAPKDANNIHMNNKTTDDDIDIFDNQSF